MRGPEPVGADALSFSASGALHATHPRPAARPTTLHSSSSLLGSVGPCLASPEPMGVVAPSCGPVAVMHVPSAGDSIGTAHVLSPRNDSTLVRSAACGDAMRAPEPVHVYPVSAGASSAFLATRRRRPATPPPRGGLPLDHDMAASSMCSSRTSSLSALSVPDSGEGPHTLDLSISDLSAESSIIGDWRVLPPQTGGCTIRARADGSMTVLLNNPGELPAVLTYADGWFCAELRSTVCTDAANIRVRYDSNSGQLLLRSEHDGWSSDFPHLRVVGT